MESKIGSESQWKSDQLFMQKMLLVLLPHAIHTQCLNQSQVPVLMKRSLWSKEIVECKRNKFGTLDGEGC